MVFGCVITSLSLGVLAADNATEADSELTLEPSITPGGWHVASECTCYNSTESEPECRCRGPAFTEIPANISSFMRRL